MHATMFFITDTAGGTSTTNITSNATANLVAFFSGVRLMQMPVTATTLPAGEYFIMQGHSSTNASTAATASNLLAISNLHQVWNNQSGIQFFGSTNATSSYVGFRHPSFGGVVSATTTNAAMDGTAVSANLVNDWYLNFADF
jgi:hypothetical protein